MTINLNPLLIPISEMFVRLNVLNGLLFHIESQLNHFRQALARQQDEGNFDPSQICVGSALVIRDLTEWPQDNWAVYYPTGSFVSQGEEYLRVTDVLLQRESAWTISQAYERFEAFLKDITAAYLHHHPHYADADKLKKNTPALAKSTLKADDIEYWKNFIRLAYRKNDVLLEYLRELAPELKQAEQHNNRGINISDWYSVASEVRHATTHSDLVIKPQRMSAFLQDKHDLLSNYFPGTSTQTGYQLKLGRKDAEKALQLFAEYAFAVFKYLSKMQHYDWEVMLEPANRKPT